MTLGRGPALPAPAHHPPLLLRRSPPPVRHGAPLRKRSPSCPWPQPLERGLPGAPEGGQLGSGAEWVFPAAVMRFMGDAPLKGQRERDVLCTLLKVSRPPCCALSPFCDSVSPSGTRVAGLWGGQLLAWPQGGPHPPEGRDWRGTRGLSHTPALFCAGMWRDLAARSCAPSRRPCGTSATAKW